MSHELQRIPFTGGGLFATPDQQVALRPACDAMGIGYGSQYNRLQRTPWAVVSMMKTTGADGKTYEMVTVDRKTFTMWLATIETSRLKNENTREMVELFQCEAADALDKFFHEGGAINPRADEHQVNAIIYQARAQMELAQASKGLIHPDHLEAKARIILARGMFEAPEIDPGKRPLYCQDYLRSKNLSTSRLRSIAGNFGKAVKRRYIEVTGREPMKYDLNLSNGQVKQVNAYVEADRWLLDEVWADKFETQSALA